MKPATRQTTYFFCEPSQISGDHCTFGRDESDHILKVFRLYIGDKILATDGAGNLYEMELTAFENRLVTAKILSRQERVNELPFHLAVAFGLPAQSKADQIIDQCTQLGVSEFIPIISKNSPGKLTADKAAQRIERWRQVAVSSIKQSLRTVLPSISNPQSIQDCAQNIPDFDLTLIGSLKGKPFAPSIIPCDTKRILLITGPEEGFSRIEEDTLIRAGALPVLLGPRRLRAELAPVALAAVVGIAPKS